MTILRILIPVAIGLVAGIINYIVVQGTITPIELTAVKADISSGTEIDSADMLVKVEVRSDSTTILKSVVPWADRGAVIGRTVNRSLLANEVVLFSDIRGDVEDPRARLLPGEATLTFTVSRSRLTPGLGPGDNVGLLVSLPAADAGQAERRVVGPVRLLSMTDPEQSYRNTGGRRRVTVAVPVGADGSLTADGRLLAAAAAPDDDGSSDKPDTRRPRMEAVEYFRPVARPPSLPSDQPPNASTGSE